MGSSTWNILDQRPKIKYVSNLVDGDANVKGV